VKIGLVSLGCPKNLVDGEVMLGLAEQAGHEITADASDADVLIVNTCAFIGPAKQESVDAILEMAEEKRRTGGRRLIVTGCLAERYRDELKAEIPEIDALLGTGEVPDIVRAIGAQPNAAAPRAHVAPVTFHRSASRTPSGATRPLPTYIYDAETPRRLTTPRHFAYVKLAEGCDYKCAFCIIPTLRGHYRSRPADSIVQEAESLAARGVREIILISQDSTFYGVDQGDRGALGRLLRRLQTVDGLEWIRLLYLYPTTIDASTLDAMGDCDKVCKYVDLPLQHASSDVLKRMKRPGNRDSYTRLLTDIRKRLPGVALRTTFIVGFPGETDEEFAELRSFVSDIEFDHVGVFTYSHEEGTSAFSLVDDVPEATKKARRAKVMKAQRAIARDAGLRRVGTTAEVMVDGPSPEHPLVLVGRLAGQAPDIDSVVYFTDCDAAEYRPGDMVPAEIVGAREYDLVVRPLSLPKTS
jgi:ribosomal protein S12 methylthiotransferase